MSDSESRLAAILNATAEAMRNELARLRPGFSQGTTKGDGTEELVRQFLRERLPSSIGITSGQALDATGAISAQLDVVLYDALRTPMLFESPHHGQHLVPVEGIIAVIEVKTRFQKSQLSGILKNCQSVKSLQREAYLPVPISYRRSAYGSEWTELPVHYSVFAFESQGMYAGELNELQADKPLHSRIDTVCYLDRGVNLNVAIDWETKEPRWSATVEPGGGLADVAAPERALVLWYAAFASVVAQTECRPIDLTRYLEGELAFEGSIPSGSLVESIKEQAINQAAADVGVDPAVVQKFADGHPVTFDEVVAIFRGGGTVSPPEGASQNDRLFIERAKEVARQLGPTAPRN